MHIVIGGAFNGKSEWVKQYYSDTSSQEFIDCQTTKAERIFEKTSSDLLILLSVHSLVKTWVKDNYQADKVRAVSQAWIEQGLNWEKAKAGRKLVLVGTDFSQGIVPMEKTMRLWRDTTGWFYQDLIKHAEMVHEIWYGLCRKLK